jgi:hypothetical protein
MSWTRGAAAGVMLLAAALPALAQTTLEWKFKEGEKFYVEAVTETKQTVTIAGKSTTVGATYTTVSQFEVKKAAADSYTLEQTLTGVQVKSNKPDDPITAVLSRYAAQAKGSTFTFTLASAGTITSKTLEGYDDFVKRLSGGNEAQEKLVRAQYPEELFRDELSRIFLPLPGKPVNKGDKWVRKETDVLAYGKLTGENTYTYDGKDTNGGEKISVSEKWTFVPAKDGQAVAGVTTATLNVDGASGQITADPAAGRLIRHEESKHITGTLTYTDAARKEITAAVDLTTTRRFRRVEENPLK